MEVLASRETAAKRLAICRACPKLIPEATIFWVKVDRPWCTVCLCDMKAKTRLANKRCPLNPPKWDKVKKK